ncbi:Putative glucuronosyltransferase GUT1 [Durusdinium trenchii]|uniref:Glucuronosyltransferase GUT1 n=1 Tax=Durusdinium trenchii TaxID=1381693 RepID=A0ABP0K9I2_9DINO
MAANPKIRRMYVDSRDGKELSWEFLQRHVARRLYILAKDGGEQPSNIKNWNKHVKEKWLLGARARKIWQQLAVKHVPVIHEYGEGGMPFLAQVEEVCKALDVERHQDEDLKLVEHIVQHSPKRPKMMGPQNDEWVFPEKEEVEMVRLRKIPKSSFDQPVQWSANYFTQQILEDEMLRQMEFVDVEDGKEAEDSEVNPLVRPLDNSEKLQDAAYVSPSDEPVIHLVRFLRLQSAHDAWHLREVQETVCTLLGIPLLRSSVREETFPEDQGTPIWARAGGRLYRSACRHCVTSRPEQVFEHAFDAIPIGQIENNEFSQILQLWPVYCTFRLQGERPMDTVQWLAFGDDEKPIATREAEDRESCVSALLGLVPGPCLAESHWHLFVARLLLSVHNDLQLFSQVQLPFCAHDARKDTALRCYTQEMPQCTASQPPHPQDLWESTKRFLTISLQAHGREGEVDGMVAQLRQQSEGIVDVAPELWKILFSGNTPEARWGGLCRLLERCENLEANVHESVLAALLAGYPKQFNLNDRVALPFSPKEVPALQAALQFLLLLKEEPSESELARFLAQLRKRAVGRHLRKINPQFLGKEELPNMRRFGALVIDFMAWWKYLQEHESTHEGPLETFFRNRGQIWKQFMEQHLPKPWENTYKTPRLRKPLSHSQVEYLRAYLLKIEWPDIYTMQRLQRHVSLRTQASFYDWRKTELPQLKRTTKASPRVRRPRVHRRLHRLWAASRHKAARRNICRPAPPNPYAPRAAQPSASDPAGYNEAGGKAGAEADENAGVSQTRENDAIVSEFSDSDWSDSST